MPFIALSPTDPAGYFISVKGSWQWEGMPPDLDAKLREASSRNETLVGLSLGLDGDWFLRTDKNHYCHTPKALDSRSNVVNLLEHFNRTGFDLSGYKIDVFTFLPDPAGCVGVMINRTVDRHQTYWDNADPSLENHLRAILPSYKGALKDVAAGKNGGWTLIQGDGEVDYYDVPAGLEQKIEASAKGSIRRIVLSLADENHWVIEYTDSSIAYNLHPKVAPIFLKKWNEEQKYLGSSNQFLPSQQIPNIQASVLSHQPPPPPPLLLLPQQQQQQQQPVNSIWAPVAAKVAGAVADQAIQIAASAFM